MEVAAAGGHNIILIGPPRKRKNNAGEKSSEYFASTYFKRSFRNHKIHSVAGKMGTETSLMTVRPFRSPHHTISDVVVIN